MLASTVITMQDNSAHGEDSFLSKDLGNGEFLDVVMDGVTGHGGEQASTELKEALDAGDLNNAEDIVQLLGEMNEDFYSVGSGRFLLTTVSAVLGRRDKVQIVSSGDSPVFLINQEGHQKLSGNLEARRDWGYAPEYVTAMWLMLQQEEPRDYVVATGETHSVRDFVNEAFRYAGMELVWEGEGLDERGIEVATGAVRVEIDPHYFRPAEVDILCGDAMRAREYLRWSPSVTFEKLVHLMVDADIRAVEDRTDYRFR